MRRSTGFTIIQTMVVLLILGIVTWFAVDLIIDKRCEADPSRPMCASRKAD